MGTPVSFLIWLIQDARRSPLGLFQPVGIIQSMAMSLESRSAMWAGANEMIHTTCPNRECLHFCMRSSLCDRLLCLVTSLFVTLSCQWFINICLWHLIWNACTRARSCLVNVHVSDAYKRIGTTRVMYNRSLVLRDRYDWRQIRFKFFIVLAARPILRSCSDREARVELIWLPR